MFTSLTRDWEGRSVFLLGGGPSLRSFNFACLRKQGVVVAINDAFRFAPWADCSFTVDCVWHNRRASDLALFAGEKIAVMPASFEAWQPNTRYLLRRTLPGLYSGMNAINTGENSGYAALGMALQRGAARVALLGYDMNGPGHFHAGYNWHSRYGVKDYRRWAQTFEHLAKHAEARGVDVFNCNRQSRVKAFRFGKVEEAFECPVPIPFAFS